MKFALYNVKETTRSLERQLVNFALQRVPARTFLLIQLFFPKHNTVATSQPPYSPEMTPCDCFYISQTQEDIQHAFQQ